MKSHPTPQGRKRKRKGEEGEEGKRRKGEKREKGKGIEGEKEGKKREEKQNSVMFLDTPLEECREAYIHISNGMTAKA